VVDAFEGNKKKLSSNDWQTVQKLRSQHVRTVLRRHTNIAEVCDGRQFLIKPARVFSQIGNSVQPIIYGWEIVYCEKVI
jgi:hypothetical protein